MAAERGEPTETHARFNQVCDEVGLRRNAAKQLIGAMCGGIQGGELNVSLGTFKSRRSAWPSCTVSGDRIPDEALDWEGRFHRDVSATTIFNFAGDL